MLQAAVY